jgi:hypothetical protein
MPDGEPTNAELARMITDVRADVNRIEGRYDALFGVVSAVQRAQDVDRATFTAKIEAITQREDRHDSFHQERDREARESAEANREAEAQKEARTSTRATIITAAATLGGVVVGVIVAVFK